MNLHDLVRKQAHMARLQREFTLCLQRASVYESAGRSQAAEYELTQAACKSDLIFCLEVGEMTVDEVAGR